MSTWSARPALRWLVPAAVVAVILGGGAATSAIRASASGDVPARTAAQLLADLRLARLDAANGTVVEHADLGLPALPDGVGGDGSSDFASLLTGAHTMRVWYSGPRMIRVSLIGALGESDVIRDGTDAWIWSSSDNAATHLNVPAAPAPAVSLPSLPSGLANTLASALPLTPLDAANDVIAALSPTTSVTSGDPVRVAGRAAYQLVIAPKDPASLVGSVRIALDAARHIPLRVRIYATSDAKPAFEIGFTKVSFAKPDPSLFRFNPPPGAKVTQGGPGIGHDPGATDDLRPPRIIGAGWTAIIDAALPADATGSTGGARSPIGELLANVPTVRGGFGSGKLLQTALFSVLLTGDGRIFIGSVDGAHLVAAASTAGT